MRCLVLFLVFAGGCATTRAAPLYGFHAGTPAEYSAALGVGAVVSRRVDSASSRAHHDRDLFVLAEPGVRAGRASLGYGIAHDDVRALTLVNARATALRRWSGGPVRDYLGIELEAETLEELSLGARVGVFKQVDGPIGRRRYLFSIDFPVGW